MGERTCLGGLVLCPSNALKMSRVRALLDLGQRNFLEPYGLLVPSNR